MVKGKKQNGRPHLLAKAFALIRLGQPRTGGRRLPDLAESDAAVWNQPSLGVSRSLGYRNGGIKRVVARPGELTEQQEVRLDRGEFVRPDWDVTVEGLEAARRDLFFAWR